jgi:hypothetical protein
MDRMDSMDVMDAMDLDGRDGPGWTTRLAGTSGRVPTTGLAPAVRLLFSSSPAPLLSPDSSLLTPLS